MSETTTLKRHDITVSLTLKLDITTVSLAKEILKKLEHGFGVSYKGEIVNSESELDEIIVGIIEDTLGGMFDEETTQSIIDEATISKNVSSTETICISDLKDDTPSKES